MKRTNRTLWGAFAIIGAALAVSAPALLAGMGHGPGQMGDNTAATRGLSADQVRQLDRIRADLEHKTVPLERRLEAKRMELEAAPAPPDSDLDRPRRLRSEIRELESRLDDAWFQARARVAKILTPERRAQEPDASWGLMGNGCWDDGWSCPWDRAMASRWNRSGWAGAPSAFPRGPQGNAETDREAAARRLTRRPTPKTREAHPPGLPPSLPIPCPCGAR